MNIYIVTGTFKGAQWVFEEWYPSEIDAAEAICKYAGEDGDPKTISRSGRYTDDLGQEYKIICLNGLRGEICLRVTREERARNLTAHAKRIHELGEWRGDINDGDSPPQIALSDAIFHTFDEGCDDDDISRTELNVTLSDCTRDDEYSDICWEMFEERCTNCFGFTHGRYEY